MCKWGELALDKSLVAGGKASGLVDGKGEVDGIALLVASMSQRSKKPGC